MLQKACYPGVVYQELESPEPGRQNEQNRVLVIGTKVLFYRVYELSDLNLQKALSITMGDLLLVGEKVIVKLIWERVD
jgi:hypothetical protein